MMRFGRVQIVAAAAAGSAAVSLPTGAEGTNAVEDPAGSATDMLEMQEAMTAAGTQGVTTQGTSADDGAGTTTQGPAATSGCPYMHELAPSGRCYPKILHCAPGQNLVDYGSCLQCLEGYQLNNAGNVCAQSLDPSEGGGETDGQQSTGAPSPDVDCVGEFAPADQGEVWDGCYGIGVGAKMRRSRQWIVLTKAEGNGKKCMRAECGEKECVHGYHYEEQAPMPADTEEHTYVCKQVGEKKLVVKVPIEIKQAQAAADETQRAADAATTATQEAAAAKAQAQANAEALRNLPNDDKDGYKQVTIVVKAVQKVLATEDVVIKGKILRSRQVENSKMLLDGAARHEALQPVAENCQTSKNAYDDICALDKPAAEIAAADNFTTCVLQYSGPARAQGQQNRRRLAGDTSADVEALKELIKAFLEAEKQTKTTLEADLKEAGGEEKLQQVNAEWTKLELAKKELEKAVSLKGASESGAVAIFKNAVQTASTTVQDVKKSKYVAVDLDKVKQAETTVEVEDFDTKVKAAKDQVDLAYVAASTAEQKAKKAAKEAQIVLEAKLAAATPPANDGNKGSEKTAKKTTATAEDDKDDEDNTGMIVGVTVGAVAALLALLAGLLSWKKTQAGGAEVEAEAKADAGVPSLPRFTDEAGDVQSHPDVSSQVAETQV